MIEFLIALALVIFLVVTPILITIGCCTYNHNKDIPSIEKTTTWRSLIKTQNLHIIKCKNEPRLLCFIDSVPVTIQECIERVENLENWKLMSITLKDIRDAGEYNIDYTVERRDQSFLVTWKDGSNVIFPKFNLDFFLQVMC